MAKNDLNHPAVTCTYCSLCGSRMGIPCKDPQGNYTQTHKVRRDEHDKINNKPFIFEKQNADVTTDEVARVVNRVVRGLNDGHCLKCNTLSDKKIVRDKRNGDLECPSCGFKITNEVQQIAMKEFGSIAKRNMAVYDKWIRSLG